MLPYESISEGILMFLSISLLLPLVFTIKPYTKTMAGLLPSPSIYPQAPNAQSPE